MSSILELDIPAPHLKQRLAFESEATDLLLGGATRGGKSYFVRYALIRWCLAIPGLQCDIYRLHHDDVVANHMQGDTSFPALLAPLVRAGLVTVTQTEIRFWHGSLITLEHASDVGAVMAKHQGIPKHVRVFEESTQIDVGLIRWLSGWVSMSEEMKSRVPEAWKGRFPRMIHTTNPIGVSAAYYRREYVQAREPYKIEQVGEWKRQYIPALVEDNPSEDAAATRRRVLGMGDSAVADALLNANWDALVGDFFPEWDEARHVVSNFWPPGHFARLRGFDWGTADPAYVAWAAVSDGEPFRDDHGEERWFPRGALIVYNEWYICDDKDPSKGARMRNEDMARGILERSELDFKNVPTLTDSKPFQDMGGEGIATTFGKAGVPLVMADTSRISGWSQLRSRLIGKLFDTNAGERLPMIYFCERCKAARNYIPTLTRHRSESRKEDATEGGEATHACDVIRYLCMARLDSYIHDNPDLLQSRIERALKSERFTIKNIMKSNGHVWR